MDQHNECVICQAAENNPHCNKYFHGTLLLMDPKGWEMNPPPTLFGRGGLIDSKPHDMGSPLIMRNFIDVI